MQVRTGPTRATPRGAASLARCPTTTSAPCCIELEPEAGRLYDRHAKVAQEWFPHDYIPYRLGRDFDKEPWTPDQPRLTGVAQTAFEIGLLTEDNLPSYHRLIHGMFGKGDGAWINWVGRWTAEEGRHAIVLRDYLTVTRNIDPIALERGRMAQLQQGYDHDAPDTLHGLAYVTFQELATRIAHRNTGRYSDDPVADKIMVRIAADENLHMVFYRDILSAAIAIEPSAAVRAIVDEVLAFQMPGAGIPNFMRKAATIAKAGIYDIRVHRDEVLMPIIKHWGIFELPNLDAAAEAARRATRPAPGRARAGRAAVRGPARRVGRRPGRLDRLTPSPGADGRAPVSLCSPCPRPQTTPCRPGRRRLERLGALASSRCPITITRRPPARRSRHSSMVRRPVAGERSRTNAGRSTSTRGSTGRRPCNARRAARRATAGRPRSSSST